MEQEGQPWMGSMGSPLATFGRRAAMDGQHGLTISNIWKKGSHGWAHH